MKSCAFVFEYSLISIFQNLHPLFALFCLVCFMKIVGIDPRTLCLQSDTVTTEPNWLVRNLSQKQVYTVRIFWLRNWEIIEISKSLFDSENLYLTILKGAESFAHIFNSWKSIFQKLLNYEYIHIYCIGMFGIMIHEMFI